AAAGERRNESRHPRCIPAGGRCRGPPDDGREPARRQNPAAGALNRNAVPSSAQPPVSGSIKGASGVTDIARSPGCYVAAVHLTSSPSLICSVEQSDAGDQMGLVRRIHSTNIFRLIDEILARPRNNPTNTFERFSDIET